jgi:voltage-gated potassium channel
MKTKFELLKQVPLFADWSRDQLEAVAAVADEIDVPAGTTLTLEGETAREFVVLIDGEATVEIQGEPVATLRGGEFLGEIALLTRSTRTATVRTTKQSRLFVLTDRAFRQLADTVPAFARRTWHSAAERAGVEHAPAA